MNFDRKTYIPTLSKLLKTYLDSKQIKKIHQAYVVAEQAHKGSMRRSGDAYITHPLAVTKILAEMHLDYQTLIAALLHDTIEDTSVTKQEVIDQFGKEIGYLVDGVTKLDKVKFASQYEATAESFIKMILAMSKDIRVILIKLADRLHNMRTINHMRPASRIRIAKETLEVYSPIALRLGMHDIKEELEELGFQSLHPYRYRIINKKIAKAQGSNKEQINKISKTINKQLKRYQIKSTVNGRLKSSYSVYRKMQNTGKSFQEILDVIGFRIIVTSVEECYLTLGSVHNLYKPLSQHFKDYIAIPKPNGYQSLHTVLLSPYNAPIEIQIRSKDMDIIAEKGIAAHWLYKSNKKSITKSNIKTQEWVASLLDMQKQSGNSIEFLENVKTDLFPNEVYVFTPKGGIMQLPKNATVIDFAYAVHTDIGNHCVAAKINKQLASITTTLESGQQVEIVTAKSAKPNPEWLSTVVTSKARTGIRHFLKKLQHEDAVILGHRMLDRALDSIGENLDSIPQRKLQNIIQEFKLKTIEELLAEIALGNQFASVIAQKLLPKTRQRIKKPSEALTISGNEKNIISYARCCFPIPDDPIIGFISTGKGIVIHRQNCQNAPELLKQPERNLTVKWDNNIAGDFLVELNIHVHNKPGVLASVAATIAGANSNIDKVEYGDKDIELTTLIFVIEVMNRIHLAKIIRKIRRNKAVIKVYRPI